jgi:hypothetical protein
VDLCMHMEWSNVMAVHMRCKASALPACPTSRIVTSCLPMVSVS